MKHRMISARNNSAMTCFVFSLYLLIGVTSGHAQDNMTGGFDMDRMVWKSLFLGAKNFFVTLNTNIRFEIFPAEDIKKNLIRVPEGTVLDTSGKIVVITVQTVIDPLMGATESIQSMAWCDIKNMAALQHIRLRLGEKDWQKTYRFTAEGVFRQKEDSGSFDKIRLPVNQKTATRESFYPYDFKKNECSSVLEPSEMFLVASLLDCSMGSKAINLCVFSKQKLYKLEVRTMELKSLKVDYIEKSAKNESRRNEYIDSIKISFKIKPSAEESRQDEEFSFLGLYGDFDIYIDNASKIPVLVSGSVPRFGKVDIRLQKVELK
jgi:hypothetical protein